MRQRAKIAAALVHDPDVLILDEPFNGTDPRQRLQLMEMLRRRAAEGRTILFSSHILEEVERLAENVLVVDQRAARRLRRLPPDPAPDDGPPAHLRAALQRQPCAGRGAGRPPARRRHRDQRWAHGRAHERLRRLRGRDRARGARQRRHAPRAASRRTSPSRACSPTWWDHDAYPAHVDGAPAARAAARDHDRAARAHPHRDHAALPPCRGTPRGRSASLSI